MILLKYLPKNLARDLATDLKIILLHYQNNCNIIDTQVARISKLFAALLIIFERST